MYGSGIEGEKEGETKRESGAEMMGPGFQF